PASFSAVTRASRSASPADADRRGVLRPARRSRRRIEIRAGSRRGDHGSVRIHPNLGQSLGVLARCHTGKTSVYAQSLQTQNGFDTLSQSSTKLVRVGRIRPPGSGSPRTRTATSCRVLLAVYERDPVPARAGAGAPRRAAATGPAPWRGAC